MKNKYPTFTIDLNPKNIEKLEKKMAMAICKYIDPKCKNPPAWYFKYAKNKASAALKAIIGNAK